MYSFIILVHVHVWQLCRDWCWLMVRLCRVVLPCFKVGLILIVTWGFHLVTFYGWEYFIMLITHLLSQLWISCTYMHVSFFSVQCLDNSWYVPLITVMWFLQGVSSQGFIRKFTSAIHGAIYGDGMQVCFVTMMPPATFRMHLSSSFILLCEASGWLIKLPNLGLHVHR